MNSEDDSTFFLQLSVVAESDRDFVSLYSVYQLCEILLSIIESLLLGKNPAKNVL